MGYVYTALGFIALIVLHEGGHFTAAKAVGMRVERFCLFFPPLIAKVRRGETEYGIGALPLGGYVKITGMNPNEDIPPEVLPRAYYNQPVWKRIVVILAGPVVNIVIAIGLVWALLMVGHLSGFVNTRIAQITPGSPAAHALRAGDEIVAADGRRGLTAIHDVIHADRCPGRAKVAGCLAARPVHLLIRRDGALRHVSIRPHYETLGGVGDMYVGVGFGVTYTHDGFWAAGSHSVSTLWHATTATVSAIVRIFEPQERKKLNSVVGTSDFTAHQFDVGASEGLYVLAIISLSLAIINLFPFLPLDGGHIFWALAEKIRRRAIPFAVMERASVVGFVLILALFAIGLTNDIHGISNGTFNVH